MPFRGLINQTIESVPCLTSFQRLHTFKRTLLRTPWQVQFLLEGSQ
jgi:hypothetical protein